MKIAHERSLIECDIRLAQEGYIAQEGFWLKGLTIAIICHLIAPVGKDFYRIVYADKDQLDNKGCVGHPHITTTLTKNQNL